MPRILTPSNLPCVCSANWATGISHYQGDICKKINNMSSIYHTMVHFVKMNHHTTSEKTSILNWIPIKTPLSWNGKTNLLWHFLTWYLLMFISMPPNLITSRVHWTTNWLWFNHHHFHCQQCVAFYSDSPHSHSCSDP